MYLIEQEKKKISVLSEKSSFPLINSSADDIPSSHCLKGEEQKKLYITSNLDI